MDFLKEIPAFKAVKNELCKNHTVKTIEGIFQGSLWALKMFDSSTKIPEGVLSGSLLHPGNFDECLDVNVDEEWGSFKGQHCMASVNINASVFLKEVKSRPFTWAICTPSSCTADDLKDFLTTALNYTINVDPLDCHVQGSRPFLPLDWLAIAVVSFFGLLCVLSTGYDITVTDPRNRREVLLIFSWYRNGIRLLNTKRSSNMLDCLHGIRFFSINWVVMGHSFSSTFRDPGINILGFAKELRNWGHVIVIGAFFAVDTFLLISSALLCYIFMETMSERGVKFNLPVYILHRYMRTTPLMAVLVLVYTSLILHFGSGPLWESHLRSDIVSHCEKNWWTALLHIQNYFHPRELCMGETWYLSVDMQLYIISPILLLPLLKKPKIGIILLELVIAASILSSFLEFYLDNQDVSVFYVAPNYAYAHTRAAPWFIGIALGYCLYRRAQWRNDIAVGRRSGLSKTVLGAGWLLAAICLVAPVLVQHQFVQDDFFPSRLEFALFKSLSKPIWSLGLSWVIFVCVSGYGGPVNAFLSWEVFQPLARLTYSIYLLHLLFIRIRTERSISVSYNDDMKMVSLWFSTMLYAILLAIPASLMFEFPISALQKLLFGDWMIKMNQKQQEVSNASQKDKINNDHFPHSVMTAGSDVSQDPNAPQNYPMKFNILDGNNIHNKMK
ncbi:hypothetical protein B7P43_G16237 [Cryptotermes secundus]|uniref:Nose resistant-to-fluoxetine protein N-terminal domain-containing protein n=1 Tax=Cryptotermes secundus TaxID=105785 RepID=A0A2J7RT77_9NEOP|nr:hypothetical protein B7P43_G16237 [Cryptotermes secundus]